MKNSRGGKKNKEMQNSVKTSKLEGIERDDFMAEIQGYYDGAVCIPLEKGKLRVNQKVIITVPDEGIFCPSRKLGTLEGKATVSFSEDWHMNDEELLGL